VDSERFQNLTAAEVAQHMHAAGPKTCAFPINGTRRWFLLEHTAQEQDLVSSYLDISVRRHIELYRLLFDHGLDTLLAPIFGPDLIERGEDYMQMAAEGLARLATDPGFLDFYRTYRVRVRFYGDYRKFFAPTAYAYLSDLFDEVTATTAPHNRHRLFFGVCAQDATETIAELAVEYHSRHGHIPDKRTLVSLYYGEHVPPVDFFIGLLRFRHAPGGNGQRGSVFHHQPITLPDRRATARHFVRSSVYPTWGRDRLLGYDTRRLELNEDILSRQSG
jgi:tuberculosinol/isotuberculosinol synthase